MHTTDSTDLDSLIRVRAGTRLILALGLTASLAANVVASEPTLVGRVVAAWPPLALMLTVELLSRVPGAGGWLSRLRVLAAASIAGIAAWVSYWHMVDVALDAGEQSIAAHLIPLSVDGLVVVASVSLVELGGQLRKLDLEATLEPEHSTLKPTTSTATVPEKATATDPGRIDTAPPPPPHGVGPAHPTPAQTSHTSTTGPQRLSPAKADKAARARELQAAGRSQADIADEIGVSARTVRRYLNETNTTSEEAAA